MTSILSPLAKQKFFDNDGNPAVGYKLFTYQAGTSTKLATFPNATTVIPNSNPIVMDYRGECDLWIPPNVAYKYVFTTPTDTDPPSAPIWSEDNVVSSQLITLYGGVDTGIANAYVLTFAANFSTYQDGIVIYWIPSHTNTGASTINVNSIGVVPIVNGDGSALFPGEIQANQIAVILAKGGQFLLLSSSVLPIPFGAGRTAAQNLPASTISTIIFDTNVNNPQSNYSLVTGIFTAPATGTYLFSAQLTLQNNAVNNGTLNAVYFSRNNIDVVTLGFTLDLYSRGLLINGGSASFAANASFILPMLQGDTMRVKVSLGAGFGGGGNFQALAGSYFSGSRIA